MLTQACLVGLKPPLAAPAAMCFCRLTYKWRSETQGPWSDHSLVWCLGCSPRSQAWEPPAGQQRSFEVDRLWQRKSSQCWSCKVSKVRFSGHCRLFTPRGSDTVSLTAQAYLPCFMISPTDRFWINMLPYGDAQIWYSCAMLRSCGSTWWRFKHWTHNIPDLQPACRRLMNKRTSLGCW